MWLSLITTHWLLVTKAICCSLVLSITSVRNIWLPQSNSIYSILAAFILDSFHAILYWFRFLLTKRFQEFFGLPQDTTRMPFFLNWQISFLSSLNFGGYYTWNGCNRDCVKIKKIKSLINDRQKPGVIHNNLLKLLDQSIQENILLFIHILIYVVLDCRKDRQWDVFFLFVLDLIFKISCLFLFSN